MAAGSRIHRKLQKMAGSYYNAEIPLKITLKKGVYNLDVTVEGRADGIIDMRHDKSYKLEDNQSQYSISNEKQLEDDISENISTGGKVPYEYSPLTNKSELQKYMFETIGIPEADVTIDEIKGVYRKLTDIEVPEFVHMAQAMCYAYIYAREETLSEINVQITYVQLETEDIKQFQVTYSYDFLEKWFDNLLDEMMKWVDYAIQHARLRDASIDNLEFPYEYREGQKNMAACVYKAIEGEKRLFVQAPTGIGKTMAAVFPTIKSFATGITSKMFYLTAKTIAATVADNAINILRDKGMVFSSVTITAKEKICPQENMECDADKCPYAKGHYDRINAALYDMIIHETRIDREVVLKYAVEHMVCPFELCLDATLFSDGIICDYNYVFDPRVNLKRFFAQVGGEKGRYVFLVDEAHNLVDRASSMYSATLIKEDFLEIKKIVRTYSKKTARHFDGCNRELLELKKKCDGKSYMILNDIGVLYYKLMNLHSALENFLEEFKHIPERKQILELYFNITNFINIADLMDDSYVIYDELLNDGKFMVKLYCVHPANNLRLCLDKGISTIFFSATILPVKYYMEMLSNTAGDMAIYIPSPFDREKRKILIGTDVTTRYTRRSHSEYEKIYGYIRSVISKKTGNYMIFFPSYGMMEQVYHIAIMDNLPGLEIIMQSQGMSEGEREEFLARFDEQKNIAAFCIMGGIFSEGIDLDHDKLIGAVVVGPGLPQVCNERKIMMDYFNNRTNEDTDIEGHTLYSQSENGFKYSYLYPGVNKVFQAAGRVIRTEEDKGVILLLDERFGNREYYELFPMEWSDAEYCTMNNVEKLLDTFWNS
jgi:Rad3-related DNA helicase